MTAFLWPLLRNVVERANLKQNQNMDPLIAMSTEISLEYIVISLLLYMNIMKFSSFLWPSAF